jgi:hypothetical protein
VRARRGLGGQATTEVVLLLPFFMFFLYAFAKIFAMLILVQKMEIASYYAARRWQLESHRNVVYEGFDDGQLCSDIEAKAACYIGQVRSDCKENGPISSFLSLQDVRLCPITRTQVWNVVTLTVYSKPIQTPVFKTEGFKWEVTKYVPNRDRPIAFVLPGLNP